MSIMINKLLVFLDSGGPGSGAKQLRSTRLAVGGTGFVFERQTTPFR